METIRENNKLIAKFMGMTIDDNDKSLLIFKTLQGNDIEEQFIDILQSYIEETYK